MTGPALPCCEVCDGPGYAITALPGIPMSCCRCGNCLAEGAVPYDVLVANTAMIGGLEHAADWWADVITATLPRARRSLGQFRADVAETLDALREPPPDPEGTESWSIPV